MPLFFAVARLLPSSSTINLFDTCRITLSKTLDPKMFIASAYVFHPRHAFRKNKTNASSVACATNLSINLEHLASIMSSTSLPSAPSNALFANVPISSTNLSSSFFSSPTTSSSSPFLSSFFFSSSNAPNAFSISTKYSFVASSS